MKALSEASKSILMLLIQPTLKYNCLTHLKLTNTQKEKPSRFDRQTEKMVGNSFNVDTENVIHKYTV